MRRDGSKRIVHANIPTPHPPEESKELFQKQDWVRIHYQVEAGFKQLAARQRRPEARLLHECIEIAGVLLKNLYGVGSHFRLAECDLSQLSLEELGQCYCLLLTYFAYHFSQMVPAYGPRMLKATATLVGPNEMCQAFQTELKSCRDHASGDFSTVRAGRCLWERLHKLLHVKRPEKESTARLYFQTAPAQDLIYMVEQGTAEGWLKF